MDTILVIEDYEEFRVFLRDVLIDQGYKVLEAADGFQGLAQCRNNHVSVVITDIIMPDKEGIETIMELRRDFPDVNIIAISGGGCISPDDYLKSAKRAGAVKTFSKPFEIADMLIAVEQLCQKNNSAKAAL